MKRVYLYASMFEIFIQGGFTDGLKNEDLSTLAMKIVLFNQVGHNEIFKGPGGRYWLSCHGIRKPAEGKQRQPFLVIDPIWFDENGRVQSKGPTYTQQKMKMK